MAKYFCATPEPWTLASEPVAHHERQVAAGLGPVFCTDAAVPPFSRVGRSPLPSHGAGFLLNQASVRLHDLPAAERGGAETLSVLSSAGDEAELVVAGQVPRPKTSGEGETGASRGDAIADFVDAGMGVIDELRLTAEYCAGRPVNVPQDIADGLERRPGHFRPGPLLVAPLPWSAVAALLLRRSDEPRMDLIVRIAETFAGDLESLVRAPRRILSRERMRTPLARVQQLDEPCLTWLVRQPGRTAVQKAGPAQQILSVVRRDDYDTLENRVLKDFLKRCVVAARLYLRQCRDFQGTQRVRLVKGFLALCQVLVSEPFLRNISDLGGLPSPNYVLQFDPSYRKLWGWYLRLVRRQQENDDAWRWHRRLWADVARLCLSSAVLRMDGVGFGVQFMCDQQLWIRGEQECGGRFLPIDWPGPIVLRHSDGHELLVKCVHPAEARSCRFCRELGVADIMGVMGSDMAVLFFPLAGSRARRGRPLVLLMWAICDALEGVGDPMVQSQCRRALEAMHAAKTRLGTSIDMRGIILRNVYEERFSDLPTASGRGSEVVGLGVPGNPDDWRGVLQDCVMPYLAECALAALGGK